MAGQVPATPAEAPRDAWLDGFRISIARSDRDAAIWYMHQRDTSAAEIARTFGLTRQRVQQVIAECTALLEAWPAAPAWLDPATRRVREMVVHARLQTPELLAEDLRARKGITSGWSQGDQVEARAFLWRLRPELLEPDPVVEARRQAQYARVALTRVEQALEALGVGNAR